MAAVYLDNNATTPLAAGVLEAMLPFFQDHFGNASSVHSYGQRARAAVESAREATAALLGAQPREIVFTSGGTEADNTALRGVVALATHPAHLVTSRVEHPAVLRCCEALEAEGHRITYLEVDRKGLTRPEALAEALEPDTVLVSIQHGNNETGVLQPVREMAALARQRGVLFHTDAVQTVGKIPGDVRHLGVDLLSLSAHKLHGPKGVGALFVRDGVELAPWMTGGSQERKRRAGTENVAGIVGLGAACALAARDPEGAVLRMGGLRDRLEQEIVSKVSGCRVNGSVGDRVPHTSNLSFDGLDGEALLVALDFEGIAVSTGAACASGSIAPSHVLTAMGLSEERIRGAIRFSLSRQTTAGEIDTAIDAVARVVARMRQAASVS